jgi:PIN domain
MRAVLRDRPDLSALQLRQVRDAMNHRAEEALVDGYDSLISSLSLPDPNDRHVLAAAIVGGANVIVTRNLQDFPDETLNSYQMEAQHPDEFVHHLIDLAPRLVVDAVRDQQAQLVRPPIGMVALLAIFERLGLTKTTAELRRLMDG